MKPSASKETDRRNFRNPGGGRTVISGVVPGAGGAGGTAGEGGGDNGRLVAKDRGALGGKDCPPDSRSVAEQLPSEGPVCSTAGAPDGRDARKLRVYTAIVNDCPVCSALGEHQAEAAGRVGGRQSEQPRGGLAS